jgi:CheY-like chemotaxis protein/nitrogen-specific signal transduction histidine kinase
LKTVGEIFVSALMRKRSEETLRKAKETAETANRAKSEFLARMSHEIRTPIHSVMGITELMLDTTLTAEQRQYLDIVKSSTDSLLEIINDILDFSKIEARLLELEETAFDLPAIVAQATQMLAQRAQEKGLNLTYHVSPRVPAALVGDPGRLRQVLVNLIGNAVKFTQQGEIGVGVQCPVDSETPTTNHRSPITLHFSVRDTGIGISKDKQALIFEAFRQADGSATREYGGTGLGLAICQQLVELMAGRIWVESAPGQGSTFHFTATFQEQAFAQPDPPSLCPSWPTQQSPMRVLLADDNAAGRLVSRKMLEKIGHTVLVAGDGAQALWVWEQHEFDLVLMDVEMPEMDGLQVTRAIREREAASGQHVPIVAMTAYATQQDRKKCLAAGMDGYLSKPVSSEKLYAVVERFMSAHPGGDGAPSAAFPEVPPVAVDLDQALQVVGGDRDLLQEAVELFLAQDYPRQLRDLRKGVERRDAQAVKTAAHGIKGSLVSFGGRAAHGLALRLETMGRENKLAGVERVLDELEAQVDQFATFFDCRTREVNQ